MSRHACLSLFTYSLWTIGVLCLLSACKPGHGGSPTPDPAFDALSSQQRVLLHKMTKSYSALFKAMSEKRLADAQLHAGGVSEAAKAVQFSLDLQSSGAVAMINLSAQQITLSPSPREASQQFEDMTRALSELLDRFPRLGDDLKRERCDQSDGASLEWLTPVAHQGLKSAPYLHKRCP